MSMDAKDYLIPTFSGNFGGRMREEEKTSRKDSSNYGMKLLCLRKNL